MSFNAPAGEQVEANAAALALKFGPGTHIAAHDPPMAIPRYRYRRHETMAEDDFYEVESRLSEARYIAEKAADDYHSNHDGWEACWPITLEIFTQEGKSLGVYEVDREAVPQFHAYKKVGLNEVE